LKRPAALDSHHRDEHGPHQDRAQLPADAQAGQRVPGELVDDEGVVDEGHTDSCVDEKKETGQELFGVLTRHPMQAIFRLSAETRIYF